MERGWTKCQLGKVGNPIETCVQRSNGLSTASSISFSVSSKLSFFFLADRSLPAGTHTRTHRQTDSLSRIWPSFFQDRFFVLTFHLFSLLGHHRKTKTFLSRGVNSSTSFLRAVSFTSLPEHHFSFSVTHFIRFGSKAGVSSSFLFFPLFFFLYISSSFP